MKKFNFSLMAKLLFAALVLVCLTTGCKKPTDGVNPEQETVAVAKIPSNSLLIGTWNSTGGDAYVITETKITYNDNVSGASYGYGWTAEFAELTDSLIIYKFTKVGELLDTSIIGKYGATSYKDLTDTPNLYCKFSDATDDSYNKGAKDSVESAKTSFADSSWFSYYGEYTR